MENIHKILDCEVKKVGERQYEFIASTIGMDRDGEVIDPAGWDLKNFRKNPVIMYGHDYDGLPIGRAPKVGISNGSLKNTVEFPPEGTYEFADIVERLVKEGFLNTESVGFIPKEWKDGNGGKGPRRTYTKQELLEISIVPVPSNPDALREAVEKGVITEEQLEIVTKPEETEDYFRVPVRGEAGKHDEHRIRTIDVSAKEGIKALYCGECKVVITYLFSKDDKYDWTMASAQAWVKEHAKIASQAEIRDEFDYLDKIVEESGLSKETATDAVDVAIRMLARAWAYHQWDSIILNVDLTKELNPIIFKRLSGGDTPVNIEESEEEVESLNNEEFREFLTEEIKRQIGGKLNA